MGGPGPNPTMIQLFWTSWLTESTLFDNLLVPGYCRTSSCPRLRRQNCADSECVLHLKPAYCHTTGLWDVLGDKRAPTCAAKRVSLSGARARASTRGCQEGVKKGSRGPVCQEGVKRVSSWCQEGVRREPGGCQEHVEKAWGVKRDSATSQKSHRTLWWVCQEGVKRLSRGCQEDLKRSDKRGTMPRGCQASFGSV